MTDQIKDKGLESSSSFKAKILAELEEASRARKQQTQILEKNDSVPEETITVTENIEDITVGPESLEVPQELLEEVVVDEFVEESEEIVQDDNTDGNIEEKLSETTDSIDEFSENSSYEDQNLEETLVFERSLVNHHLDEEQIEEVSTEEQAEDIDVSEGGPFSDWQKNEPVLESDATEVGALATKYSGEQDMGRQGRKRTNRVAAKISKIVAGVITLLILLGVLLSFFYISSSIGPLDKNSTEYVQVEIPSGSGNKLIGQILKEQGVIRDANVFNFYTKFKNYSNFQSGFYNFRKNMSLDEIAEYLQAGGTAEPQRPALGKVTIPEGYTIKQIAKAVALNTNTEDSSDKTIFSSEEFLDLIQDETFIAKMVEKYPGLLSSLPDASIATYRLEGYLFPATYDYYEDTTLEAFVEQLIAATDANLSPYYSQIANMGMTVNDILTMASLVEKEGATDDDREMIASVFYNRINTGMPLQSNIAILYAMDKLGEKTTLAEDAGIDTSIDSPYNIYQNPGLMPGPVDSPSLSAILATINPASSDYLYFVADVTTGIVYFSETFEEHSAYVEEHVNSKLN